MALDSNEQFFWDRVFEASFAAQGHEDQAASVANRALLARRAGPGSSVEAAARLRRAASSALKLLGPSAPACSGCAVEWNQAIEALRDALA